MGAMQILLEAGADPNIVGQTTTPLAYACMIGDMKSFKLLIEAGADPQNIYDKAHSQGSNNLHTASQEGHTDIVKLLLKAGVDIDGGCISQEVFLYLAGICVVGQIVVRYRALVMLYHPFHSQYHSITISIILTTTLLRYTATDGGETALYAACKLGHLDCVGVLLAAGADVNKRKQITGFTPLIIAAQGGLNTPNFNEFQGSIIKV